jgi:hypothetical protein
MNKFGIDVTTEDVKLLIRELTRLAHVYSAEYGGYYLADRSYAQVHVHTDLTEEQLQDWLYDQSEADYVGTFVVSED